MRVDINNLIKLYPFLKKPTVYQMVAERRIPHYKVGKRLIFDSKEIEEWFEGQRVKTREEIMVDVATKVLINKRKNK
jgi:excisionase family DNA binding protein